MYLISNKTREDLIKLLRSIERQGDPGESQTKIAERWRRAALLSKKLNQPKRTIQD